MRPHRSPATAGSHIAEVKASYVSMQSHPKDTNALLLNAKSVRSIQPVPEPYNDDLSFSMVPVPGGCVMVGTPVSAVDSLRSPMQRRVQAPLSRRAQ